MLHETPMSTMGAMSDCLYLIKRDARGGLFPWSRTTITGRTEPKRKPTTILARAEDGLTASANQIIHSHDIHMTNN